MCGFVGIFGGGAQERASTLALLGRMSDAITHRGPDDAGLWCVPEHEIGFAHRRLAIVDLSPAGHQPMASVSERYTLAFNGEIYNHMALRLALEREGRAPQWRGHSDTETLLACIDAWGVRGTVEKAIGMFAFALWDAAQRRLTLGRDRLGEKPLYYGWMGQGRDAVFLFGSELKALRQHPRFEPAIHRGAISLLLRHNYIPAPYSIYQAVSKLGAGSLLTVSQDAPAPIIETFWCAARVARQGVAEPFAGSPAQAVDALEVLLKDAVRQQMMADVPLGAFLSGGIDSSTVVALMHSQAVRPVKTFTIGFHEAGYDEAEHAAAVARYLGTEHTELYVTPEQARAVIPRLPALYDEPFADSSQIPTFLVSQLARSEVTVALSGDAGDELFCGYNRYALTSRLWGKLGAMPLGLRRLVASGLTSVPTSAWNGLASALAPVLPRAARMANTGDKLHKGAGVLDSESVEALYLRLVSHWPNPAAAVLDGKEPPTLLNGAAPALDGLDDVQRMMALDMMTYLPDDILVKVDRAAMAVSLEGRVPFLDHRVVEFAWQLPQSMKLRDGQTKWALRQVLYRHVPQHLIERPKMGFGVPIGTWLRGPLRPWAEELLGASRLREEGFFDAALVRKTWDEHVSGQRNWQYQLWDVLMFQAWLEQQ
ncbi:asparagine synthase (glutamine-hydrolyzing) [Massilia sp. PAMC28688]|uniref:asparagine synthase (glutamine-hydrolyzing) n=1 Tax=Massilia sp. PAMC28688 TaxID=2861283 RepID=UPI001C6257E4|nr:asparagine synthase (glutamine-hydrolyzing) [Massilia sp. PAMC28688]QYF91987.1 asparagine synthase (glutamine-hydrolyzing) [Massilia sp. PAMC28688]